MITKQTATSIYHCHEQIKNAEKLIADMREAIKVHGTPQLIDVFGRRQNTWELGVPSGMNGHRIFSVDPELGFVVIEAQILKYKSQILALNELARNECLSDSIDWEPAKQD